MSDTKKECDICEKLFKDDRSLKAHKNWVHTEAQNVTCDICQQSYRSSKRLKAHEREVHGENRKAEKCEFCEDSFIKLKNHIATKHSQDNFQCDICQRSYGGIRNLKAHQKQVHTESHRKAITCEFCGISISFNKLKRHMETLRSKAELSCDICKETFVGSYNFKQHFASAHKGEKIHKCDQCEFSAKTHGELTIHYQGVHLKRKRYPCPECKERFGTKLLLNKHALEAHETAIKTFDCSECEYSSQNRTYLNRHFKAAHTDKTFDCDICQRSFGYSTNLRRHKAMVHKDLSQANKQQVHKCDRCDY